MLSNKKYALNEKGNTLNNVGNYTGAITYYDKSLAIDPKFEDALNLKGGALRGLGNYTGAIEYYDKTLVIDPNDTYYLGLKQEALFKSYFLAYPRI